MSVINIPSNISLQPHSLASSADHSEDSKCPQCDENTVILHSDTGEFICTSCGYVLEHTLIDDLDTYATAQTGVQLQQDRTTAPLAGVAGNRAVCNNSSVFTRERKTGEVFVYIDRITTSLEIQSVRERAKFLFVQSTKMASFNRRFGEVGNIRAAACVYAASLETDKAVPINIVAGAAGVTSHKLGSVYKELHRDLNLEKDIYQPRTAFQYVERCVSRCEFGTKRPAGCESNSQIIQIATRVLNIVDESGILIGRIPQCSAAAAVLVAIDALTLKQNGALTKIVATSIECAPTTVRTRYNEFRSRLQRSAQTLPWGKHVTMRSLPTHLQSILDQLHERIYPPASDDAPEPMFCTLSSSIELLCQDSESQALFPSDETQTPVVQPSATSQPAILSSDQYHSIQSRSASPTASVSSDGEDTTTSVCTVPTGTWKKRKLTEDEDRSDRKKILKYTGKPMPPAFERSVIQRALRIQKISKARRRMRELDEMPITPDRTPPLSPSDVSCEKTSACDTPDNSQSLDAEDMMIYALLRYGVPESQFMESTSLHMQYLLSRIQPNTLTARPNANTLDDVELSERDMSEQELLMYLRTFTD